MDVVKEKDTPWPRWKYAMAQNKAKLRWQLNGKN